MIAPLNRVRRKWKTIKSRADAVPRWDLVKGAFQCHLERRPLIWTQAKLAEHPVCLRRNSSDKYVFRQIFVERNYGGLDDLRDVRLVLDCGANVGYSAAYFLSRHPGCEVLAVESDPDNFAMLEANLAPYGSRAKAVHAGVWSHTARLAVSRERYRDGREWSRQVRACAPGEPSDLGGLDILSLLAQSGHDRISLLKMDIEGAEAVLFSSNCESWLKLVDTIAIELHDDSTFGNASDPFFSAISGQQFEVSRSGDLTVCRRPLAAPLAEAA